MQRRIKGAALLTTLFITAIIAIIATAFETHIHHLIAATSWSKQSNQLSLALQGVRYWGESRIIHAKAVAGGVVLPMQYSVMPPTQYHQIQIKGKIVDQQGLYNINMLTNEKNANSFVRLCHTLGARYSTQQLYLIAQAIHNSLLMHQGASGSSTYTDITDLLTVKTMPRALYQQLKPYLTAIPSNNSPININTVNRAVLIAVSSNLDQRQATAIMQCVRSNGPFLDTNTFARLCLTPLGISSLPNISVASENFLVIGEARLEEQQSTLKTFFHLMQIKGKLNAVALWQSIT